MHNVITDGKTKVGAYNIPDRKRIALCVEEENEIVICGYFTKPLYADYFMTKLSELVGAKRKVDNGEI